MCKFCSTHGTYAQLYNHAYRVRDRDAWAADTLTRLSQRGCLRLRSRFARHMQTMCRTQSIFGQLSSETFARVEHRAWSSRCEVIMRTRRLSRSMLRFTFRPVHGRMFAKTMREATTATRNAN